MGIAGRGAVFFDLVIGPISSRMLRLTASTSLLTAFAIIMADASCCCAALPARCFPCG
jgi:hypothetical protein